jgi:uncharacterized protein (DUF983 family)
MSDNINHPAHYTGVLVRGSEVECIEVIEALHLNYHVGNAFKYLWRHERKGASLEDLRKAIWYLSREIELRTSAAAILKPEPAAPAAPQPAKVAKAKSHPKNASGRGLLVLKTCPKCGERKGAQAFLAGEPACRKCQTAGKVSRLTKRCTRCGQPKGVTAFPGGGEVCALCLAKPDAANPAPPTNGAKAVYRLSQEQMGEYRDDAADIHAAARDVARRTGKPTVLVMSPTGKVLAELAASVGVAVG